MIKQISIAAVLCIHVLVMYPAPRIQVPTKNKFTESLQQMHAKKYTHRAGEPLRILFVVENFPLFDQPFILDQIAELLDRGHDIYIAAKHNAHASIVPEVVDRYNLMDRTLFFGLSN